MSRQHFCNQPIRCKLLNSRGEAGAEVVVAEDGRTDLYVRRGHRETLVIINSHSLGFKSNVLMTIISK